MSRRPSPAAVADDSLSASAMSQSGSTSSLPGRKRRQASSGPSQPPVSTSSKRLSTSLSASPNLAQSQGDFLLAPDYPLNAAGPAASSETTFACPQCDKRYRGKHARSIWRRHLSDKHGIPLSAQPRRTRWDNDANRPQTEEERRSRILASKRRWAKKARARQRGESEESGDSEMDGEGDERDEGVGPPELGIGLEDEDDVGAMGEGSGSASGSGSGSGEDAVAPAPQSPKKKPSPRKKTKSLSPTVSRSPTKPKPAPKSPNKKAPASPASASTSAFPTTASASASAAPTARFANLLLLRSGRDAESLSPSSSSSVRGTATHGLGLPFAEHQMEMQEEEQAGSLLLALRQGSSPVKPPAEMGSPVI